MYIVGGGLVFGVVLSFLLPKQYTSTVQLMPPDNQSNTSMLMTGVLAQAGGGLGALANNLLGVKNTGELFVGILHSHTVENRVIQRFDLKSVYRDSFEEDARTDLAEHSDISEDRKNGIITITVTDRQARRAAAMAQAYVEELDRLVAQTSSSAAHRERVFLEDRLQKVKQDLDVASRNFSQFASKNGTLDIKEQGKTMMEAAAAIQGQLIAAESDLKELQEVYAAGNIRIKSAQARVAELRQQLDKIGGNTGTIAPSVAASDYPSIRQLPILGVTYADLYRQTKIQEAVYETLTEEYEFAKVQEARETPSVKVLDAAEIPERKSSPKRKEIVLMSSFVAFFAGLLSILVSRWWLHLNSADPVKVLGQEVFQSVNSRMPWAPPSGSHVQALANQMWTRLLRRNSSESVLRQ
jgi:capsule polysaccharide export protein KpsE/RkpR